GPGENCRKFQRAVRPKAWRRQQCIGSDAAALGWPHYYFTWRHNGVSVCQAPGTTRPHFVRRRCGNSVANGVREHSTCNPTSTAAWPASWELDICPDWVNLLD